MTKRFCLCVHNEMGFTVEVVSAENDFYQWQYIMRLWRFTQSKQESGHFAELYNHLERPISIVH